ncbi:MAG TPA: PBP1A family penicillin-binding protein [Vicinamibacterales bacterium]|nr:PBP1A family penicillin-binding protein [Vicinamibacterales bacterium]
MAHYVIRLARSATIVALFAVAALLGILSGVLFAFASDLPEISALDNYNPSTITRVYAANGDVIGEFAVQRRLVIGYDDISPKLREAIISAEDADFNSHFGLSISRILITLLRDVFERRLGNPAGASTLTQQLARNLFPIGFEKSIDRKVKEALLAIQIEKRYTKREILTLYCNQIHFGHGTNGVEAAARLYFNKRAKDLTLEEAALIAGIIQSPARQSPYVDMNAAVRRRNYVLGRMAEERYITAADAETAKASPIALKGQPQPERSMAPFYLEEVRKHLEREYGAKALYESGLAVTTTLDPALQQFANRAIEKGLRTYDKRHGWRRPTRNVINDTHTVDAYRDERWKSPIRVGDIVPAVVAALGKPAPAGGARLIVGPYHADLGRDGFGWTRKAAASDLVNVGDLVDVQIKTIDDETKTATVSLEQTPVAEAAMVVLDNHTGQVKAMVGGWDFQRSKFNRAVQAYRQLGSTFKPIVYTAAIDRGFTPASIIIDSPVAYPSGNGGTWAPQNYDHTFMGPITLRYAVEESRNIPAIKMMDELGVKTVLDYAKRFGFEEEFPPYLPIALGAGDATLMEITSAYTAFPNQGMRMKPWSIINVKDREGNLLEQNRAEPTDVIGADSAYVMTSILRGVLSPRGTGARAAEMARKWPLAGKTGTVDNNTDAWFIGFDPDITVGVWIGLDDKRKSLGGDEQGAKAALPIWMDFMQAYIDRRTDKETPPDFQAPGNIVFLAVDKSTGVATPQDTPGAITDAFIAGTEPGGLSRTPQP